MPVSTPQTAPEISAEAAATAIRKARGAMARYRFMAIVTGVMLLVLCVELGIKYGLGAVTDVDGVMPFIAWVPFAHGWIYVAYLVTVADLWSKMRWGFGRLVTMVLAGVVPVMSFVLEKKIHTEAEAKLVALEKRYLA
jgi:integral membrane protein